MIESAKKDACAADDSTRAERSDRLPWVAPRVDSYAVGDTDAATPHSPGTDGSFTLS